MKSLQDRRQMVEKEHSHLSILNQCELLGLHRSGLYYKVRGESELNLELMRLIDEKYLKRPDYGAPRMHTWLTKDMNYKVSKNRIERLYYRIMGLRAIVPGPHTAKRRKDHKVYPYLLRGLKMGRPNQVWAMDITYIPMRKGFLYLTAIIDLFSRYVVSWSVSNTQDGDWVADVFRSAVIANGAPEIINTDQGSQFTSDEFVRAVKEARVKLSMDGKGRAIDNIFIERLWRTVKYEDIYLHSYEDGMELHTGLKAYFRYYNEERRHTSIGKEPPKNWYRQAA